MSRESLDSGLRLTRAGWLEVDIEGGVICLRADYDPQLVERIKRLPGRRYSSETREWTVPARRAALYDLCELLIGYDGRLDVRYSGRALRRLSRQGPGRITLEEGQVRLWAPYQPRRLERIRAIPELRFERASKTWAGPPTRAGAIALLDLLADRELLTDASTRARLERVAAAPEGHQLRQLAAQSASGSSRSSPVPHWRHVTSGPVFDANPQRQEWVEGIGWCVRVRVDPERRRGGKR